MLKFVLADRHARSLSQSEISRLLVQPNILRIAYLDERGDPISHPVWYYYSRDKFILATDREGKKAKLLKKIHMYTSLLIKAPAKMVRLD
ncbi:MAG: pyridoxamine 5'-phosphate oxidase family protein [Nitrososphaera sp.]